MRILIDKALNNFGVIGKSILCKHGFFFLLNIKGKHKFKHFYYIHIVDKLTQKGEHS